MPAMVKLKIMFICIANTCRSPMAEAMARQIGGNSVEAFSGGLMATGSVAEGSISTLEYLGYDADGLESKSISDVEIAEMDVIVSLIGPDGLRYLPAGISAELVTWVVRDPYGEDEEAYLTAARTIEKKVKILLTEQLDRELPLL